MSIIVTYITLTLLHRVKGIGNKMVEKDKKAFGIWLKARLNERDMSQSELARDAGVARSTISGVIIGVRDPGNGLCIAIAKSLRIPPNEVFEAAGILPPSKKTGLDQINYLLSLLSEDEQEEVANYITFRLEKKKKGQNGDHHKVVRVVETESV